jgi:nucleoside-diphosphate-sugar epimerase
MRLVVVGARSFVGGAVVAEGRSRGCEVVERRAEDPADTDASTVVVYVSGVSFGASAQPLVAIRRHVIDAARWVAAPHRRFVYVSSTRVYDGAATTREDAVLAVRPGETDVYISSKVAGESIVLAHDADTVVVRLSNAAGPSTQSRLFLSDVLRQAVETGEVHLRSTLVSSKDYLDVRDAAAWTLDVASAEPGGERVVNVAAGRNIAHGTWLDALGALLPVRVMIAPGSPDVIFAPIDIERIQAAFPRRLRDPIAELPGYLDAFRAAS